MSATEEKTNLEHFNFYLREFVTQLSVVYPKGKQSLESTYTELLTNQNYKDDKFIKLFMRKAYPVSNHIREKNGDLFAKECMLIEGFDFAELWAYPKLTENSKKSIWKYLTLLYIYGRTVVSPPQQIEKMIKNFETFGDTEAPTDASAAMLQQMLNNLKEKNELGEDKDEEGESKSSGLPFNLDMGSLLGNLGGSGFLGGLMNDIKEEFKDIELPENPTDIGSVLKSLQDPSTQAKMQNIMGKMAKHFEGGNMGDLSKLQEQAKQMMSGMGITPEQMQKQAEAMGLNQGQLNRMKTTNRNESARMRLQKKLQDKQSQNGDKQ
jgi:hypothetical protein